MPDGNSGADATEGLIPTFAACLLTLALGFSVVYHATDGGRSYTTESLRRGQVERAPAELPDFAVVDATGRVQSLRALLADGDRTWIVDFVYTRCQTLCSALGSVYQQLQREIVGRGLAGRVGLLSISFDPERDGPPELRDYAERLQMQDGVWSAVSLKDPRDRRRLLESFGIMVLPAPLGEFEHNAAFHVVDRRARLLHIADLAEPGRALERATSGREP